MYKIEIGGTLRRLIQTFYLFGIWRNENESDFRKSCMRLPYLIHYSSYLIFLLTYAFLSGDKDQLIFLVAVSTCVLIIVIKLWYLLYRKDEILQFLYDPIVTHCITDYAESIEVKNKIGNFVKFIQVFILALIAIFFLINTISLPIFTSEKSLPLFVRFNLEGDYAMIIYWVAFLYSTLGIFLSVTYVFTIVFIWYLMFNYSIEYKILGNKFRRLGKTSEKTTKLSFHKDLIDLIKAHQKLFKYVAR